MTKAQLLIFAQSLSNLYYNKKREHFLEHPVSYDILIWL